MGEREVRPPTVWELSSAAEVVRTALPMTPVVAASELGERVWLKLETLQPTGSFKVRAGLAAITAAPEGPVVTASAGNHGLGLAYAGHGRGRYRRLAGQG